MKINVSEIFFDHVDCPGVDEGPSFVLFLSADFLNVYGYKDDSLYTGGNKHLKMSLGYAILLSQ